MLSRISPICTRQHSSIHTGLSWWVLGRSRCVHKDIRCPSCEINRLMMMKYYLLITSQPSDIKKLVNLIFNPLRPKMLCESESVCYSFMNKILNISKVGTVENIKLGKRHVTNNLKWCPRQNIYLK
jgi:hypothetical protein